MKTNDNEITSETLDQLSSMAVARRRALLRGVGKGAAVLAATAPLQTLAGQSLLTFDGKHQCSVSGQHSGVHSATPTNTARCSGFRPDYWGQPATSGPGPLRTWPTDYRQKFINIFTQSGFSNSITLFQVMQNNGQFTNADERHWLCAYLNALASATSSLNFPYSAAQVLAYYNTGKGSTVYLDALKFFTDYMETRTS
jgi:hypothetical protein